MSHNVRFFKLIVTVLDDSEDSPRWKIHGRMLRDSTVPFVPTENMYFLSQLNRFEDVVTDVGWNEDDERFELATAPHYLSVAETVEDAYKELSEQGWSVDDTFEDIEEDEYLADL